MRSVEGDSSSRRPGRGGRKIETLLPTWFQICAIVAGILFSGLAVAVLDGEAAAAEPPTADSEPARAADPRVRSLEESHREATVALMLAETELSSAQDGLEAATEARERAESRLQVEQAALEDRRRDLSEARRRLHSRVRSAYKLGSFGWLDLLIESDTFGAVFRRIEALETLVDRDAELVNEVAQAIEETRRAAERLSELAQARSRRVEELEESREELERARDRQAEIVASLGSELEEVRARIEQAEREMAKINSEHGDGKAAGAQSPGGIAANNESGSDESGSEESGSDKPAGGGRGAGEGSTVGRPAGGETERQRPANTPGRPGPGDGRKLEVKATAYALRGATATGIPAGPGVIAVDPSVIPLGTRLYVPGYGEGIAADTGGAVRGNYIDVWLPSQRQALDWGVKRLTITILG